MARKAIIDTYYTFNPTTRQIVIPRAIQKERLVLITNMSTNQVIFNFSDPNLKTTGYSVDTDISGAFTTTTITLNYNTNNGIMQSTDKLQIIIDEYDEKFTPSESYIDPVNKMRVSTPQALIDTDFEYGLQQTKWEQLALLSNKPFAYYDISSPLNIQDVRANTGSRNYIIITPNPLPIGNAFTILDTSYAGADGTYVVDSNTATSMTYAGKFPFLGVSSPATGNSVFVSGVSVGYRANTFTGANIGINAIVSTANLVTVTTNIAHGLLIGNEIAVTGLTGTSAANGSFIVSGIINPTTFQYWSNQANTGSPVIAPGAALYVRPQGSAVHRSFDGGVRFSTNAASHNQAFIRQTRRYFRYQSGKGIQLSTGTTLKPQYNIDALVANGTTGVVTVTTKDPHDISNTVTVSVQGANESAYNGYFSVKDVLTPYQFTYTANSIPSNLIASGNYVASVSNWYGAKNQIGIFDQQNGLFWEFDGQTLFAVRRTSTYQIGGTVSATPGSHVITGTGTIFNKQLSVNDFVVIKGMSYRVTDILSDQRMFVTPAYRGAVPISLAQLSKTIDIKTPQSAFNIDRMDGTGPSGYDIDLTKMQMFYVDYSWYGAGFVRYGVRGPDGNIIYCHKYINNNVNYLAYMRSGNLPGRYETSTYSKSTFLTANLAISDTQAVCGDLTGFPPAGTVVIRSANTGGTNIANTEYINYSGISGNTLTGLTRGQAGNVVGIWANTTTGNTTVTILGSNNTVGVQVGQQVFGINVQSQAYVTQITPNVSIKLSSAAIGTGNSFLYFPPMANLAQTFIVITSDATAAQTVVDLHAPSFGPEINHWGTSAIMDGGFTNDKSLIFTQGMNTNLVVGTGNTQPIMSFRIAPSVSNGIANTFIGVREIINRMQQIPYALDCYANGSFLLSVVFNGKTSNTAENWTNVGGSSLSQYIIHTINTTISGGETAFGFYTSANPGTFSSTQQSLIDVRDLGTSILSGGTANASVAIYPDGPDVLTIVARNIDNAPRGIQARYSWNEAQA
jgi:hypothetical protein